MGKLLWHTMMGLDGFIAGPNDDMSWAFGMDAGSGETVDAVLSSTGALLVGRRTQDVEDRLQPGFYGGAFRGPFFVLRHDPPPAPPVVKGVTGRFLDVGIEEAVTIAKRAAGGRDVVVLGANIAGQCLEKGLLDEIIVHVAQVLVGDGVRLFERAGGDPVRLDPISSVDRGRDDGAPLLGWTRVALLTRAIAKAPRQDSASQVGRWLPLPPASTTRRTERAESCVPCLHGFGGAQGSATAPLVSARSRVSGGLREASMQMSTADGCDVVIEVAEAAGCRPFLGLDVYAEMVRPSWSPFPVRRAEEG